ncbi:MAG: hydrogenase nickel incorporation protein HypB [Planctomycetes bacterium]|nr:hydrogenase nickel incorporation protein HypB [Planctomycetota bacterium]
MTTTDARQRILAANESAARTLRELFRSRGTLVLNLISSPGSGKTSLLEATARALRGELRMACVVGDVATELDADRLRAAGLPSHQIVTGGACHLDARMVETALRQAAFGDLDLLFLENVGNLVCPTAYDLGEDAKVALLSVAEGHDKPFKYPGIFAKAAVTVLTKLDLLGHVDFDLERARTQILSLNPGARVLPLSVRDGAGLDAWLGWLRARARACRAEALRA